MPKSAYPVAADLTGLLTVTGLDVPPTLDVAGRCAAAAAEWEDRTGWNPYLAAVDGQGQPVVSTRLFDPPATTGRSLCLQGGLLSLVSLAVGVIPGRTGSYAPGAGSLLTANLNFYLRPQNALSRGLAFTEVEFLSRIRGVPQSIAITGVWGRVSSLPDDVWQVILQKAALECLPELGISVSSGLVKIDDVQYLTGAGGSPLLNAAAQWGPNFTKQVRLKKRLVA